MKNSEKSYSFAVQHNQTQKVTDPPQNKGDQQEISVGDGKKSQNPEIKTNSAPNNLLTVDSLKRVSLKSDEIFSFMGSEIDQLDKSFLNETTFFLRCKNMDSPQLSKTNINQFQKCDHSYLKKKLKFVCQKFSILKNQNSQALLYQLNNLLKQYKRSFKGFMQIIQCYDKIIQQLTKSNLHLKQQNVKQEVCIRRLQEQIKLMNKSGNQLCGQYKEQQFNRNSEIMEKNDKKKHLPISHSDLIPVNSSGVNNQTFKSGKNNPKKIAAVDHDNTLIYTPQTTKKFKRIVLQDDKCSINISSNRSKNINDAQSPQKDYHNLQYFKEGPSNINFDISQGIKTSSMIVHSPRHEKKDEGFKIPDKESKDSFLKKTYFLQNKISQMKDQLRRENIKSTSPNANRFKKQG